MNPLQEKIKEVNRRSEQEIATALTHQRELAEFEHQFQILRKEVILPAYNEAVANFKEAHDTDFETITSNISWKKERESIHIKGDVLEVESNGNSIVLVWIYADTDLRKIILNFRSLFASDIVTEECPIGTVTRNEVLKFIAECYSKSCL